MEDDGEGGGEGDDDGEGEGEEDDEAEGAEGEGEGEGAMEDEGGLSVASASADLLPAPSLAPTSEVAAGEEGGAAEAVAAAGPNGPLGHYWRDPPATLVSHVFCSPKLLKLKSEMLNMVSLFPLPKPSAASASALAFSAPGLLSPVNRPRGRPPLTVRAEPDEALGLDAAEWAEQVWARDYSLTLDPWPCPWPCP